MSTKANKPVQARAADRGPTAVIIGVVFAFGAFVGNVTANIVHDGEERAAAEVAAEEAEEALRVERITDLVDIDADEVIEADGSGWSYRYAYEVENEAEFCTTAADPHVLEPTAYVLRESHPGCYEVWTTANAAAVDELEAQEAARDAVRYVLVEPSDNVDTRYHVYEMDGAQVVELATYEANRLLRDLAFQLRAQDARLEVSVVSELDGTTILGFTPVATEVGAA
jgi:hypothetical protein